MKHVSIAALLVTLGTPVLAHPGHDAAPATHWIADLSHASVTLGLAALSIVALGGLLSRRRARARRKTE
jgi:hypothetical protein